MINLLKETLEALKEIKEKGKVRNE